MRQGGFGVPSSKPSFSFQLPGRLTTLAAASTPTTNKPVIAMPRAARTFIPLPCMKRAVCRRRSRRALGAPMQGYAVHCLNQAPMASPETQTPIPVFDVQLEEKHVEAVAATLRSGWLTLGPRTQEFEAEFAEHIGAPHAIAVSSCTSALHLAYLAAGIGPGDEVIVPGITFVASPAAVRYCGGVPVIAEVAGQHDLGLDPEDVAARIGPKTKAVCAVHYGGYAAPLGPLQELCDEHGLVLIWYAAH